LVFRGAPKYDGLYVFRGIYLFLYLGKNAGNKEAKKYLFDQKAHYGLIFWVKVNKKYALGI
jgi:hypothetical protein